VTGTVYAYLSPLALILFLFSPKAHVWTWKMGWSAYFVSSNGLLILHNKLFFALHHYSSLSLVCWDRWWTWCVEPLEFEHRA
jgi:hypothetical protein